MGPTEWTIIGIAVAMFLALGSLIKFGNSANQNALNGGIANVRTEIANVRTEIAEVRTEVAGLRTELKGGIDELRTELKGDIANVRTEIAELRTELKGDMAELRVELKGDMADLRTELKLDFQANRAEIITNRRMLGRFALHRHGEDGLPLAPLTDTLEPPDASGEQPGNENGSD
jgi:septal ring factor EnvC (AmiA/AmiB activator)